MKRKINTENTECREAGKPRTPKEGFFFFWGAGLPRLSVLGVLGVKILFSITPLNATPGYFEPWGKDAHLLHSAPSAVQKDRSIPTKLAHALIDFHQKVISPVDGPRSHYRPSSSQYMREAMQRYGFLKGFIMGCDRLLRENDEMWVYRTIEDNGQVFKYDPAKDNKNDLP